VTVDWSDLDRLGFRVRPISIWPGVATPEGARQESPFRATVKRADEDGLARWRRQGTPFRTTVRDLSRELGMINARRPELQLALRDRDIRQDGYPRADARLQHPGVVLAFAMPALGGQRLTYAVDRFTTWQDNLRAIALGLEALRKVQRYGMGSGYEQYAGYRALPEVSSQTPEQARAVLRELAGPDAGNGLKRTDDWWFRQAAKRAQHLGDGELNAAMNAGRVLGVVT
jgi:hypothetical protein